MARFSHFHRKFPSNPKPTQPKLKINHKTHLIPTNNTSEHQFHTIPYTFSILIFHTNLYKSIQIHTIVSIPGFLNFSSSSLLLVFLLLLLFLFSSLLFSSLLSFYPNALTFYTKNEIFAKAMFGFIQNLTSNSIFAIWSFLFILIAIQFLNIFILAYNLLII